MIVIRNRLGIHLADGSLLSTNDAGKVSEVISRQRNIRGKRLSDRLPVIPGLHRREHLEIVVDDLRDLLEHLSALCRRSLSPCRLGRMCRIKSPVYIRSVRTRNLADRLARDRRDVLKVGARDRSNPLATNVVAIL